MTGGSHLEPLWIGGYMNLLYVRRQPEGTRGIRPCRATERRASISRPIGMRRIPAGPFLSKGFRGQFDIMVVRLALRLFP